MFGSIGGTELLLIMVIALLVFGPRKLPQLGRTIGRAMGEFRRASNDFRSSLEREIEVEDKKPKPSPESAPEPAPDPLAHPAPKSLAKPQPSPTEAKPTE